MQHVVSTSGASARTFVDQDSLCRSPRRTACPGRSQRPEHHHLLTARPDPHRAAGCAAAGPQLREHGPRAAPAGRGVAAAVARDRAAATARNGAAAFRAHPLLLLPPVLIIASATLAYVMLSAVSITFPQATPGDPARSAPAAPGPASEPAPGAVPGARGGGGPGTGTAPGRTSPSRRRSASPRPSGPGSSAPPGGSGSPGSGAVGLGAARPGPVELAARPRPRRRRPRRAPASTWA